MKIALIAPPFLPVPPLRYGGTELFIANLALGLTHQGHEVIVYTNGDSTLPVELRWLYPHQQWPLRGEIYDNLKDVNHSSWAVRDAIDAGCDIIHLNNVAGLANSRLTSLPFVYTLHHAATDHLTDFYKDFPAVEFVTISEFQRQQHPLHKTRTIHHGIDPDAYRCGGGKRDYAVFLGRIAPIKGTHIAIEVAKRSGVPLKIAGEVQPIFQDYFDNEIRPHIDGKFIEYVGEVGLEEKNVLLGSARALLFPIDWEEPFGLVMIEAMACGAPVLAFKAGSVPEIVTDGESGYICTDAAEMSDRLKAEPIEAKTVRASFEKYFSRETMAAHYISLYQEVLADTADTSNTLTMLESREDSGGSRMGDSEQKAVA